MSARQLELALDPDSLDGGGRGLSARWGWEAGRQPWVGGGGGKRPLLNFLGLEGNGKKLRFFSAGVSNQTKQFVCRLYSMEVLLYKCAECSS